ncbi:MAG: hypothetical protein ACOYOP_01180 [Microthrixaceae bacterium]
MYRTDLTTTALGATWRPSVVSSRRSTIARTMPVSVPMNAAARERHALKRSIAHFPGFASTPRGAPPL